MSESASPDDADECRVVVDVAMETATERCGSEAAVKRQLMDMFGFADDEPEPDCETVLEGGVTEENLADIEAQRRYSMCRAWELVNEEEMAFRQAINEAWGELRAAEDQ